MNKFKEIKKYISNEEIARKYLGSPIKSNSTGLWYKSPFRSERTASFCVSKKGIHDFGDSTHYDIISFISKLYCISQKEALEMIARDFNIPFEINEYETNEILNNAIKRKREQDEAQKRVSNYYKSELIKICDEIKINNKSKEILKDTLYFEALALLEEKIENDEMYFENLINMKEEEKLEFYLENKH